MTYVSIYIHIPFCTHRCGYCDFNTYTGLEALIPVYTKAVCMEIELLASSLEDKITVSTIFFGGGTPSLLPIIEVEKILATVNKHFQIQSPPEISFEANPGTVTMAYLIQLHSLGINRLSLGMQSAKQDELYLLERQHSYKDVLNVVEWSRTAGVTNLNLDLIYGLPNQELRSWKKNIQAALSLQPEHLSLYALTIEEDTPLYRKIEAGLLPEPDQDQAADMYEEASERLAEAGYCQYEISNWARSDQNGELYSCKHNLQYWRSLPYLGLGAGAHGFINHQRTENVATPGEYIRRLIKNSSLSVRNTFPRTPATLKIVPLDEEMEIGEMMMMGLRLVSEGVSNKEFQQRFGISLQQRFAHQIDRLISIGLLEWLGKEGEVLRITHRGRLLGNQAFKEFI
jgi:oxygen-independent coproporphyrinogen-3 oxidase